jgi:hypothetical protein
MEVLLAPGVMQLVFACQASAGVVGYNDPAWETWIE